MAERIPLTDPNLIAREDKAIADVRELFPDGKVERLDQLDRPLGKRLSKLYVQIGYETRRDMMEAWGFTIVENKGGRKRTLDPEALIAEIGRRYEGKPKPKTVREISDDNPDLAGNIRSLMNMSTEFYGQGLVKELADRGILERARGSSDVTDDELRAMVADLEATYATADKKWQTIAALKEAHPEYRIEFDMLARRSELVFGMKQRELLVLRGILAGGRTVRTIDASEQEVWEAINELGELLVAQPDDQKPKSIAELAKAHPEQGPYVRAGQKMGIVDKRPLQMLGILQPTKTLVRSDGIGRSSLETLAEAYRVAGGGTVVLPGSVAATQLVPGVVGVDLANKVELRELVKGLCGVAAKGLAVGDRLAVTIPAHKGYDWETWNDIVVTRPDGTEHKLAAYDHRVSETLLNESPSELMHLAGAEVVSVGTNGDQSFAQVRLRVVGELQASTLAWSLRSRGLVDERDIRGHMGWHFRVWQLEHGFASLEDFGIQARDEEEPQQSAVGNPAGEDDVASNVVASEPANDVATEDGPATPAAGGNDVAAEVLPFVSSESTSPDLEVAERGVSLLATEKPDFTFGFAVKGGIRQTSELEPESELEPKPEPVPETEPKPVPEPEPGSEPVPESEPEPEPEPELVCGSPSELPTDEEGLLGEGISLPAGFVLSYAEKPGDAYLSTSRAGRMGEALDNTLLAQRRREEEAVALHDMLQRLAHVLQLMVNKRKADEERARKAADEQAQKEALEKLHREAEAWAATYGGASGNNASAQDERERIISEYVSGVSRSATSTQDESERIARENAARDEHLEQLRAKWAAEAAQREAAAEMATAKKSDSGDYFSASHATTSEQGESERIAHENAAREDRLEQLRAKWAAEAAQRERTAAAVEANASKSSEPSYWYERTGTQPKPAPQTPARTQPQTKSATKPTKPATNKTTPASSTKPATTNASTRQGAAGCGTFLVVFLLVAIVWRDFIAAVIVSSIAYFIAYFATASNK